MTTWAHNTGIVGVIIVVCSAYDADVLVSNLRFDGPARRSSGGVIQHHHRGVWRRHVNDAENSGKRGISRPRRSLNPYVLVQPYSESTANVDRCFKWDRVGPCD